jgi:hypothetical protein
MFGSRFVIGGSAKCALVGTSANYTLLIIERCTFVSPATYNATMIDGTGSTAASEWRITDCTLDGTTNSTTTAGTDMWVRPSVWADLIFRGNIVTGTFSYWLFLEGKAIVAANDFSGSGTVVDNDGSLAIVTGNRFTSSTIAIAATGSTVAEGNTFTTVTTRYSGTAFTYAELDRYETQVNTGTTPSFSAYTEFTEYVSNSTVPTCTMADGFYKGQLKRVLFRNTSGGNWVSVAFTGASVSRVTALPALDVTAGSMKMTSWVWTDPVTPGTFLWLKFAET